MKHLVNRLKQAVEKVKQWMNRKDDDYFNHPFAIL
jgi:hypothetical protein